MKWTQKTAVLFLVFLVTSASDVLLRHHHCPSCRLLQHPALADPDHHHSLVEEVSHEPSVNAVATTADSARLESIKRQILVKLGLNAKPNVSTLPPRDFILETLLRAEESTLDPQPRPAAHHHRHRASHGLTEDSTALVDVGVLEDDFYGKTSEIISFAEPGPRLNGQVLAEFSRAQEMHQMSIEPSLRVKAATLWLYVQLLPSSVTATSSHHHHHRNKHPANPDPSHHRKPPTLYIFRVLPHGHRAHNTTDKNWTNELLVSQRVTLQHSGWMKLNLTEGVQKWFSSTSTHDPQSHHSSKLRLLVDCSGCGSSVEPVLFGGNSSSPSPTFKRKRRKRRQQPEMTTSESRHRPFLVVHTDSTNARRLRRRTPLDCSPSTRQCCKQRFFVSFKALGWDDWIIAPSGYYANYCRGDCGSGPSGSGPRTPDTFINYHSHVLEEFRKLPPGTSSSASDSPSYNLMMHHQPCCAPTKFSSMSLIYFGPDMNIIKRDLPKMVVDECGCP